MGKINVKNGTPVGNVNLCRSCLMGQCMTGYRESDVLVICTNSNPNIVVPFTVYECTEYADKHKPNWEQMEKLAVDFQPLRISKTAGFRITETPQPMRKCEPDEDESEAEVARVK